MMKTINQLVIMYWRMSGGMWLIPASYRSYVSIVPFPRHLDHCYKLLNVSSSCSDDELRTAYLSLAKLYHPDVNSQVSDPKKFAAIEEAYRMITAHRRDLKLAVSTENSQKIEHADFDIKHTAPQHRQYLELEGYGFGTPSQRLRQYEQKRATTAVENVIDYRTKNQISSEEDALVVKDKQETKKRTMRSAIDRLVEDLIAESMAKGDFDNLPGQGKPLQYSNHNPYVDSTTHNLNKVLINNGYAPPWITLEKEIRHDMMKATEKLRTAYIRARGQSQSSATFRHKKQTEIEFRETVSEVNKKINRLNMLVPILRLQMVHYNADRLVQQLINDVSSSATAEGIAAQFESADSDNSLNDITEKTSLKEILKQIKAILGS